jgi:glycerol-3-phosphate dehydrogenase (NAD(P)+)
MQRMNTLKIGVVGAGSWGTALSQLLAEKGFVVHLWAFEAEVKHQIEAFRENRVFLPDISLSPNIVPSNDLETVTAGKDLVVVVVPSHLLRSVSESFSGFLSGDAIVVSASKGIEDITLLTMSAVLKETLSRIDPGHIAVISGPSFAREVARKVPTVVTVASRDPAVGEFVQAAFATSYFRVYTNDDLIGVELGGAVKNVIAIASGMIDGLGLGLNTRAALIARGLTEIRRLGIRLGANPHTFAGLAGVGDLILTATGNLSRNYTVGYRIGKGETLSEILGEMLMVAEGVKTAKSVFNLSRKLNVEMPICWEIYHILYEGISPKEALKRLMSRDLKHELNDFVGGSESGR